MVRVAPAIARSAALKDKDCDKQWELGVLRPPTTTKRTNAKPFDPDAPALVKNGKPRKRIWAEDGVEEGVEFPADVGGDLAAELHHTVSDAARDPEVPGLERFLGPGFDPVGV